MKLLQLMLLVLMVFTRTRADQDSATPETQLVVPGTQRTNRKHKTNKSTDVAIEQPDDSDVDALIDQPTEPSVVEVVVPPTKRGPNLNKKATLSLSTLPSGSKINLTMDKTTKRFIGASSQQFSTECGIVIRTCCPMNFHRWDLLQEDDKITMYEKLEGKFNLLRKDLVFMEYVNNQLHTQWKRTRGVLSEHWKKNGGRANPQTARLNMKSDCKSKEDWNHLCDYWELEKTKNYSEKMQLNRGKQNNISRGGSRSIANHFFQSTNPETHLQPSPLQMHYNLHFKPDKNGWLNDDAHIQYENILKKKETAIADLKLQGTTITTDMEHEIEEDAIRSVCGREKTLKSGWEFGRGPVLKKKDNWMKLVAESSKQDTTEKEVSNPKMHELEETNKKLTQFLKSKFPDFNIETSQVNGSVGGQSGGENSC